MKNIISKLQDISQKAAQIKQAVDAAPAKAAEIRQAVALTAGQFHQLGAEVQSTVASLQADSVDRIVQSLHEISGSSETFEEAGYILQGVDAELGLVQKLIVHLEKVEDIPRTTLRSLIDANQARKTTHALLSALLKADELTAQVQVHNLTYRELLVYVGPAPTVRICWRAAVTDKAEELVPDTQEIPVVPAASTSPLFGQGSFFERRAPAALPATQTVTSTMAQEPQAPIPSITAPLETKNVSEVAPGGSDWRQSALDRFKKMPNLAKHTKR